MLKCCEVSVRSTLRLSEAYGDAHNIGFPSSFPKDLFGIGCINEVLERVYPIVGWLLSVCGLHCCYHHGPDREEENRSLHRTHAGGLAALL